MSESGSIAKPFALVVGATYLLVGLVGFTVTGFEGVVLDGPDSLIGFDLNPFHNVVHIGIGLILLVASQLDTTITEGVLIGGGLVYLLAALLGFLGGLEIISIAGSDELAADNFLHLFSGAAAVAVGMISASRTQRRLAAS